MAPEVLDGWSKGKHDGDSAAVVPFGMQASWELGVLLHELATAGKHPFGDEYPRKLHDGTSPPKGRVQEALRSCTTPAPSRSLLTTRPPGLVRVIDGLLKVDPAERMNVRQAVVALRNEINPHAARRTCSWAVMIMWLGVLMICSVCAMLCLSSDTMSALFRSATTCAPESLGRLLDDMLM